MAQGDIVFYNSAKVNFIAGDIDWDADTIKCSLHVAYTPDIDTHEDFADVSASEMSNGNGYTTGGETLTTKTNTKDTVNDQADVDADDVSWSNLNNGTPSHAILYKDTGTPATSLLICHVELGVASNGGDYTIAWNAGGIFTVT